MRGRKAKMPKAAAGMPKMPGVKMPRAARTAGAGMPRARRPRAMGADPGASPLADLGMLRRTPFRGGGL